MMDLEDFAPAKPETGLVNPFLNPDSVRWENGVVSGDPDKGLVLSIYSKYLLNGDEPNDPVLDKSNGADYFIWELPSDVNFISNLSSTSILTIYLIHLILKHLLITWNLGLKKFPIHLSIYNNKLIIFKMKPNS